MAEHDWTDFELQTMLALILRQIHITGRPDLEADKAITFGVLKRKTTKDTPQNWYRRQHRARMDFVSMFNEAVNGKGAYDNDVSANEILAKLDELLITKKHIFGHNGLAQRGKAHRITRALTIAFQRTHGMDFDGKTEEREKAKKDDGADDRRDDVRAPPKSTDKPRRTADTYVPSATRRYNKYKEVDPGFAEFARPVAKVSKYAAPIVDYDGESADEGEIREVAQIEDEEI